MTIYGFQGMFSQPRESRPTEFERAEVSHAEALSQTTVFVSEKTDVERRVVSDKDAVSDKLAKAPEDLLRTWMTDKHLIGYAVHLPRGQGNPLVGIYERLKFLSRLPSLDDHGSDLNDSFSSLWRQPRRLDVKAYITLPDPMFR